jgi:hypothetical protein
MSESEIRAILRTVCERLARQVVVPVGKMAVPVALGAALATGTGCFPGGDTPDSVLIYSAPDVEVIADLGGDPAAQDALNDMTDPGPILPYMGPDVPTQVDAGYMAPDPGPVPEYMALDAVDPDPGVQPPYMAPDSGPVPEYMALDAVDPR